MSYDEDNNEEVKEDTNFKLEEGDDDLDEPIEDADFDFGDDDPDNRYH